jgi:hypothetical protein
MTTFQPSERLGLVLHPHADPTPVVQRLTSWARSHGKRVIVDARDAGRVPDDVEPVSEAQRRTELGETLAVRLRPRAGLVVRLDPERLERRSGVKLSLLDLPFLPEEMRDLLPGSDPVALSLDS